MSPESLIYLVIWIIVIVGLAYVVALLLAKAEVPPIIINGVWLVAALIVLLVLLRQVGVMRIGTLEPAIWQRLV